MKFWLTMLLLVLAAAVTTWLLRQFNPAAEAPPEPTSHAPDYYLEDATLTQLNPQGELESRVVSKLITHYPDDGRIELAEPRTTWYGEARDKTPPWRVTARHGTIPATDDLVQLNGDVVVTHPTPSGGTLKILSPTLTLYTKKREARTSDPVRIVRGPSHVHAVGMRIDMRRDHMRLESAVRGMYVH
jgi:lipopolysaccharide export system protein LptC